MTPRLVGGLQEDTGPNKSMRGLKRLTHTHTRSLGRPLGCYDIDWISLTLNKNKKKGGNKQKGMILTPTQLAQGTDVA